MPASVERRHFPNISAGRLVERDGEDQRGGENCELAGEADLTASGLALRIRNRAFLSGY